MCIPFVILHYCLCEWVSKCALLGQGLYIQSKCTTIGDTICDAIDGYHSVRLSNSQCLHAEKHRVCKPGQETQAPGMFLKKQF